MKVLAIDIETSPCRGYFFGIFDQNIGLNQIEEQTRMLCFAAKWLGERKVHFFSEHHDGTDVMVQAAHDLLSEADVVLHYNGVSFDVKHLNREFLEHGHGPPAPFQQIDLLSVMRGNFKFVSNKLENVSRQLGLEGKVKHEGMGLWLKCMAGDDAAWARMRKYNRRDVTLLEDLYELVQPWIKGHPNRNLHTGLEGCPRCGAGPDRLQKRGFHRTQVSTFQRYQCQECGGWTRDGKRTDSTKRRTV